MELTTKAKTRAETDPCACDATVSAQGVPPQSDPISQPAHYTHSVVEPIDAIEAWRLGFHLGNVVKYIARADHKGSRLADLKKARWYLDREIERGEVIK